MYIVAGFYTPNYAEIAATFRGNLEEYSIPHCLYAVDMLGGTWLAQTLRKPEIALRALDEHPDKSVILMDVDCRVHGDLSPLLEGECDVALCIRPPLKERLDGRTTTSSRVTVFHQTTGARALITNWHSRCAIAIQNVTAMLTMPPNRRLDVPSDERLLIEAVSATTHLILRVLSLAEGAALDGIREGQLISHESTHRDIYPYAVERKNWQSTLVSRIAQHLPHRK